MNLLLSLVHHSNRDIIKVIHHLLFLLFLMSQLLLSELSLWMGYMLRLNWYIIKELIPLGKLIGIFRFRGNWLWILSLEVILVKVFFFNKTYISCMDCRRIELLVGSYTVHIGERLISQSLHMLIVADTKIAIVRWLWRIVSCHILMHIMALKVLIIHNWLVILVITASIVTILHFSNFQNWVVFVQIFIVRTIMLILEVEVLVR